MDIKKIFPFFGGGDSEGNEPSAGSAGGPDDSSRDGASDQSRVASEAKSDREPEQGDVSIEKEPHIAPPELRGPGYVVGKSLRNDKPIRLPAEGRIHTLLVGKSGTGKTTYMLTQMLQDAERGNSVFVFDPQGDLAERFMSFLPKDRWKDVVYVNPTTHDEYEEGVVKFNFLSFEKIRQTDLETDAFMKPLEKLYTDFWGPRLQGIMTHGINLLRNQENENTTLFNLAKILSNDSWRNSLLHDANEHQKRFWEHDFEKMPQKAPTAALTKMYKLTQSETLRPMIDTTYDTVDLYDCMQKGKIVIFDLRTSQLAEGYPGFLGSLFLARLTMLGMVRQEIPKEDRTPVHVYADEAHRFVTETIADNMRTLRKYRVYFTIASQNLQEYGAKARNELPELAQTVVAFQSGRGTAEGVESAFSMIGEGDRRRVSDSITDLKFYNFYMRTEVGSEKRIEEIPARTIDPGTGPTNPPDLIRSSLKIYGEQPQLERRINLKDVEFSLKKFPPVQYYILQTVCTANEIRKDELKRKMEEDYSISKQATNTALGKLAAKGLLAERQKETRRDIVDEMLFYTPTTDGGQELYPLWTPHPRMGGGDHVEMICRLMKKFRKRNCYPVPLDGEKETRKVVEKDEWRKRGAIPDLLVFLPAKMGEKNIRPDSWRKKVLLVEAEAFPRGEKSGGAKGSGTKGSRTVDHFRTADEAGLPVVFGVKKKDKDYVERKLREDAGATVVDDVIGRPRSGFAELFPLDMERGKFLFDADEGGMSEDLNRDSIPEKLESRFKAEGHRMPEDPSLSVDERDRRWKVGGEEGKRVYVVRKKGDKLSVYGGDIGRNLREQIDKMKEKAQEMQRKQEESRDRTLLLNQLPERIDEAEGERADRLQKVKLDFQHPDIEVGLEETIGRLKEMNVPIDGIKELTGEKGEESEREDKEEKAEEEKVEEEETIAGRAGPQPKRERKKEAEKEIQKETGESEEEKPEGLDVSKVLEGSKIETEEQKSTEPEPEAETSQGEGGAPEPIPAEIETLEDLTAVRDRLKELVEDDSRSEEAVDLISYLGEKYGFRRSGGSIRLRAKITIPEEEEKKWRERSVSPPDDRVKRLFEKAGIKT